MPLTPQTADPARAAEVFYDGACPVCRREIALYQGMTDRDVAWTDVSGPPPEDAAPLTLDRETLLARFHVRRADGTIASGFAAFLAVWRASPRLSWIARVLDRQPFLWIGDGFYWAFLKVRPLWRRPPASQSRG